MIATHLLQLQREAQAAQKPLPPQEKKLTLCVEGNISAGKSTFLRMLTKEFTLHEMVEVRSSAAFQFDLFFFPACTIFLGCTFCRHLTVCSIADNLCCQNGMG